MITVVYTIMAVLLLAVGTVAPALAVQEEDDKENVMIRIGQMLLTGNYSIPTPPFWYQNSSWVDELDN